MKTATASAFSSKVLSLVALFSLLAFIPAAQAKLTPRDGLDPAAPIDVVSVHGAQLERNKFSEPPSEPEALHRAGRCTVRAIVFEKMRLAEACY